MKQRNLKKKLMAILLAAAMAVNVFPGFGSKVHGAEPPDGPDSTQFATTDELRSFNTNDSDSDGKNPAKVYFGTNRTKDKRQWWIAGSQDGNLTLFAANSLNDYQLFDEATDIKSYSAAWQCDYTGSGSTVPTDVYPNHYGSSQIRSDLNELTKVSPYNSTFTSTELELMNATTIYTYDLKNNSVYSTTDKLYLAYGDEKDTYITVGKNSASALNNGLHIDMPYWNADFFLRAPYRGKTSPAGTWKLSASITFSSVDYMGIMTHIQLRPAFELDLRSAAFASAAPAATSDGDLALKDVDGDGAFTLRYTPPANIQTGTAAISDSKESAVITNTGSGKTYLVAQNKNGAWAKEVKNGDLVFASEMSDTLTSFNNCKVWLEITSDGVTYASMASDRTDTKAKNVKVNAGQNMAVTSGNNLQPGVSGAITDITIQADEGYYFSDEYVTGLDGQLGGLTAVKENDGSALTISGTPTSDVNITLPDANKLFRVVIIPEDGMQVKSGGLTQQIQNGKEMVPVVIEAADGYIFLDNYSVAKQNGITVTRNSGSQITVSGTPTADTALTLPAAAQTVFDITQFASKDQLKNFDTNDTNKQITPSAKVYFGQNGSGQAQAWWIVGHDTNSQNADNLVLFAASPLAAETPFKPDLDMQNALKQRIPYSTDWNCDYITTGGSNPAEVYPNHYGASPLRITTLKSIEINPSYFSNAEQALMKDTVIYTNDENNGSVYSTADKLYLAFGEYNHIKKEYITVGTNSPDSLNDGLHIDERYREGGKFWLRTPGLSASNSHSALTAWPTGTVILCGVQSTQPTLMPAFEFDLSSVVFASTAPAAASAGPLLVDENAMTLRYKDESLGSAVISSDKATVEFSGTVPNDTYLVVQNKEGAWTVKAAESGNPLSASTISHKLASFKDCKVWLERTNSTERKTYAKMAKFSGPYSVNVVENTGLTITSDNKKQEIQEGHPIKDITVQVNAGYYLPEGYISSVQVSHGLTLTETDTGFKISGTPDEDTIIALPAAAQQQYCIDLSGDGTFGSLCKEYTPDKVTAKEFTITNTGSEDLMNLQISIDGADSDNFALTWNNEAASIQPNATIRVTVKPKDNLGIKDYRAQLFVSADHCNPVTAALQFEVKDHKYIHYVSNHDASCTQDGTKTASCDYGCGSTNTLPDDGSRLEHDYIWTYNNDAVCEKDGTETGICKNCKAKATRVKTGTALEHQSSDWIIDTNAAAATDGKKHKECTICGKVLESAAIPAMGVREKPSKASGLKLDNATANSLNFSWKKTTGVQYLLVLSKGTKTVSTIYTTDNSCNFKNLGAATVYTLKITPYVETNGTKLYASSTASLKAATAPAKAKLLSVKKKGNSRATITWKKVKGADGYEISMRIGKGRYKAIKAITKSKTVSFTKSGLKKGKAYSFRIRAYKKADRKKSYGSYSKSKTLKIK